MGRGDALPDLPSVEPKKSKSAVKEALDVDVVTVDAGCDKEGAAAARVGAAVGAVAVDAD